MSRTVLTLENVKALAARDGGMYCHYCKRPIDHIENLAIEITKTEKYTMYTMTSWDAERAVQVDHKHPKSKGGSDDLDNLVLACTKCNQKKGAKTYNAFIEWLKNR